MAKLSKRKQMYNEKVNKETNYELDQALSLLQDVAKANFDQSVEVAFKMNLDPTKAEQQLRGAIVLPNGTGKTAKILVFAEGDAAKEAQAAGADYVGADDLVEKIQKENWFDFDVVVATPQMMPKIGKIGQILGPKGLMPNPKTGTVTPDVKTAIEEIKSGKVTYRLDKLANVHTIIGKMSFTPEQLAQNFMALYNEIMRVKPSTAKGNYIENITISSTMGPGIKIDLKKLS